jgi:TPR repeat protein
MGERWAGAAIQCTDWREFKLISGFCLGVADSARGKFEYGMCRETGRQPPRRHGALDLFNPMLTVKIHKVDGKAHANGVHCFAGKYPQTLAQSKLLAAQQALPALFTSVGDIHAIGQYGLPSDIGDAHMKVRGLLPAHEAVEYAR